MKYLKQCTICLVNTSSLVLGVSRNPWSHSGGEDFNVFLFFVDSSLWPVWRIDWWGVGETLAMV